jgi:hypothetical protein
MKYIVFLLAVASARLAASDAASTLYHVAGFAAETCSCSAPCLCDITGDGAQTCRGVGILVISKGDFGGEDLSGVSIAYAYNAEEWSRLYIQAPSDAKRALAERFFRGSHPEWTIENVSDAKIEFSPSNSGYEVSVNEGKTIAFSFVPIIGKDRKTPIVFSNIDAEIMRTYFQGKSAEGTLFLDGERRLGIPAGHSAIYNDKWDISGSVERVPVASKKSST